MGNINGANLNRSIPLPIIGKGNEMIVVLAIAVVETIVLTALVKDYGVELSGETTESGFKGSIKLYPESKE